MTNWHRSYVYDPQDGTGITYRWDGPLTNTVTVWVAELDLHGLPVEPATQVDSFDVETPHVTMSNGRRVALSLADVDVAVNVARHHTTRLVNADLARRSEHAEEMGALEAVATDQPHDVMGPSSICLCGRPDTDPIHAVEEPAR